MTTPCADCGRPVGNDGGPPDGWQLEDGRTVCQACCCADMHRIAATAKKVKEEMAPRLY